MTVIDADDFALEKATYAKLREYGILFISSSQMTTSFSVWPYDLWTVVL
jgi:hypothetical protein